jgi:hypothetical protein
MAFLEGDSDDLAAGERLLRIGQHRCPHCGLRKAENGDVCQQGR